MPPYLFFHWKFSQFRRIWIKTEISFPCGFDIFSYIEFSWIHRKLSRVINASAVCFYRKMPEDYLKCTSSTCIVVLLLTCIVPITHA